MAKPQQNTCKNCDRSFDPSFAYCPHCGQEAADRLTFGILFSNTISNYFSVDARFFRSFIPLLLKPGILARRFVDGKRLTYLHPAQFYLFISVIFFFIFSFSVRRADTKVSQVLKEGFGKEQILDSLELKRDSLAIETAREVMKENQVFTGISDEELQLIDSAIVAQRDAPEVSFNFDRGKLDSLIAIGASQEEKLRAMGMKAEADGFTRRFFVQMLKFYEQQGGGILKAFYDTIPVAMFFMLPIFAFLLKIFYWRRGTFAHHMVFSFYYFTFLFAAFCILMLLNRLLEIPSWVQGLFYLAFLVYLFVALRNFYKSSWLGSILRSGLISFTFLILVLPVAFMGIVFVAFMLY